MIVCDKPHSHLIGLDGGLRHVPSTMVQELEKLGWQQVVNPKRTYYAEHDRTSISYREQEIVGNTEDETLDIEII